MYIPTTPHVTVATQHPRSLGLTSSRRRPFPLQIFPHSALSAPIAPRRSSLHQPTDPSSFTSVAFLKSKNAKRKKKSQALRRTVLRLSAVADIRPKTQLCVSVSAAWVLSLRSRSGSRAGGNVRIGVFFSWPECTVHLEHDMRCVLGLE